MVYEILATTPFGKEKKGEVGIERMVEEGAYSAAFPLHDVSFFLYSMLKKFEKNLSFFFSCAKLVKANAILMIFFVTFFLFFSKNENAKKER